MKENKLQTESYIDQLKTLVVFKRYLNGKYDHEFCDITFTTDSGYPSFEFCGGVYEVSIIPVDFEKGLEGDVKFIASHGDELIAFDNLIEAVECFFSCIDNAITTQAA